ncbi:MAG: recombinase family protein [Desulfotomaculaceae bacterium]|nr:recombinase family protein [Desulfotomaculaceae bacterium]
MLKAIGYIRVSDKEQGKEERFSIPHQREHIEEYCHQRQWRLLKVHEDVESGKGTARRKGLKDALKALEQADILVVHELDRLSRNLMDTLLIVNDVASIRKFFVSIHDNIDSSIDEKWELQFHILAVFAHYFRKQLSRKVHETMLTKAQKGEWNSKPPYGYILKKKHLAINEDEAWIVRRIFDLYLNRQYGIRAVAIDLNRDTHAKNGGSWAYAEIKRILKNPAYAGDSVWNVRKRSGTRDLLRLEGEWVVVRNTHEPIIARDIFEAVQERIKLRAEFRGTARSRVYLLSGILRCGLCGGKMHGANRKSHFSKTKGRALDHFRYMCTNYCKKGTCQSFKIESLELDKKVQEYIENFLGPKEEVLSLVKKEQHDPKAISDKKRKLEGQKRKLATIPDKLDMQMQALENRRITEREFDRARNRVLTEEESLIKEIALLEEELVGVNEEDMRRYSMGDYYDVFPAGDIMVKKTWLQKHIEKIVVSPDNFIVTFKEY